MNDKRKLKKELQNIIDQNLAEANDGSIASQMAVVQAQSRLDKLVNNPDPALAPIIFNGKLIFIK
tara:strand:- start:138 stop:332 length:195 start_codon:yes stop_codon:yes gene_type:complete